MLNCDYLHADSNLKLSIHSFCSDFISLIMASEDTCVCVCSDVCLCRSCLSAEGASLWERCFGHMLHLQNHNVLSTDLILQIFTPLLVLNNATYTDKVSLSPASCSQHPSCIATHKKSIWHVSFLILQILHYRTIH